MIEITLPWPDKRLSPNSRKGWRAKAEATKEARSIGYCEAYLKGHHRQFEGRDCRLEQSITIHPPDKRHRDQDNILASLKPAIDGICEAIWIDDSRIKRTTLEWGEVTPGGKVVLTLEEIGND